MEDKAMSNLFEKITKGSILLWNVNDESELPKRKEIVRLLGTEDFSCYKAHGHHRNYIRSLGRLKYCLSPDTGEEGPGYWATIPISHFYFTAERIQPNSFFILKYSKICSGSFYVENNDFTKLSKRLHNYHHARHLFDEVKRWPEKVEKHKEELLESGIQDTVIENFDVDCLKAMTERYGTQAIDKTLSDLRDWHDKHYWTGQTSQSSADEPAEQAATA